MRYFLSSDAEKKIKSQPPAISRLVTALLKLIEKHDKESLLKGSIGGNPPYVLPNEIYIFRFGIQDFHIYATFGQDFEGDYITISDFAFHSDQISPYIEASYKNPRTNPAINPSMNSEINPRTNSAINPSINSAINPSINSAINPSINSAINPRRNPAINPRRNSAIDPRRNSAINPRRNSVINPHMNVAYGGPFVYSIELEPKGFVVRANDKVELIFNLNSDFRSFCVQANDQVFVLFDENNEWIGFLVKAGADVRLRFDLNNKWTGLLV